MTTFEEEQPEQPERQVTMPLSVYEAKLYEAHLEGYDEGYDTGFDAGWDQCEAEGVEEEVAEEELEDVLGDVIHEHFEISDEDDDER